MIKRIVAWIITLIRIVLGLVVIKTGYDYASGNGVFAYREADALTGVFIMILGAYFVQSSLARHFSNQSE